MNDDMSPLDCLIRFCLEQKLVVVLLAGLLIGWGIAVGRARRARGAQSFHVRILYHRADIP